MSDAHRSEVHKALRGLGHDGHAVLGSRGEGGSTPSAVCSRQARASVACTALRGPGQRLDLKPNPYPNSMAVMRPRAGRSRGGAMHARGLGAWCVVGSARCTHAGVVMQCVRNAVGVRGCGPVGLWQWPGAWRVMLLACGAAAVAWCIAHDAVGLWAVAVARCMACDAVGLWAAVAWCTLVPGGRGAHPGRSGRDEEDEVQPILVAALPNVPRLLQRDVWHKQACSVRVRVRVRCVCVCARRMSRRVQNSPRAPSLPRSCWAALPRPHCTCPHRTACVHDTPKRPPT